MTLIIAVSKQKQFLQKQIVQVKTAAAQIVALENQTEQSVRVKRAV